LARIKVGLDKKLYLGNLDAKRDWGHARDYVEMQWLMLQQETPRDFVIATGEQHSVREFVELSCKELGIDLEWSGERRFGEGRGRLERRGDRRGGSAVLPAWPRWTTLLGDPTEAEEVLGWRPKTRGSIWFGCVPSNAPIPTQLITDQTSQVCDGHFFTRANIHDIDVAVVVHEKYACICKIIHEQKLAKWGS
jgi:hypothetical protein